MKIRRVALLFLGLAGSILVSAVLFISAEGAFVKEEILPTAQQMQAEEKRGTDFPIPVPGTSVQIERISAYEGPFLEDGSDAEVVDIAAIHIRNTGNQVLLRVSVTLQYEANAYVFCGEYIPPGETVVLLEQYAQAYLSEGFSVCYGSQILFEEPIQNGVFVTDRSMGTVLVTNLTEKTLQNVQLYYKSWLSPPDIYMGGITYTVNIPVLLPEQTVCLYPPHYAAGYTRVMFVTAVE